MIADTAETGKREKVYFSKVADARVLCMFVPRTHPLCGQREVESLLNFLCFNASHKAVRLRRIIWRSPTEARLPAPGHAISTREKFPHTSSGESGELQTERMEAKVRPDECDREQDRLDHFGLGIPPADRSNPDPHLRPEKCPVRPDVPGVVRRVPSLEYRHDVGAPGTGAELPVPVDREHLVFFDCVPGAREHERLAHEVLGDSSPQVAAA